MATTKSDLLAQGCKSITAIVDNDTGAGLEAFFQQSDECVFTMGACHVFAVALVNHLYSAGISVFPFPVLNQGSTSHYVVGLSADGPFADVHLQLMSLSDIRGFWQNNILSIGPKVDLTGSQKHESRLAYHAGTDVLGIAFLCHSTDFVRLGREKADQYLKANESKLQSLIAAFANYC